jgi:valyl-tRNA synthetase
MDTWATSSVSPQIITNWKDKGGYDVEFKQLYPMTLRPQAHDIIRTWAFYTITKGLYNCDNIPWKNIMISGHAQDPHGRKMSKSLGNVIEPEDMIKKYSADALRYWAASSKLGDDLPFQDKDLMTGQKTVTKLWNASKFSMMHLADYNNTPATHLELMDRWLLSKMNRMIQDCTDNFEHYEYSKTKQDVDKFFWNALCDYYLEIIKDRIYNAEKRGIEPRKAAQETLYKSLITVIKMMAPIMPHITESIYQMYFAEKENCKSIHISAWPTSNSKLIDEEAEKAGDLIIAIIGAVRKFKSENKVSLKKEIALTIECPEEVKTIINSAKEDLLSTCNAVKFQFGKANTALEGQENIKISIEMVE